MKDPLKESLVVATQKLGEFVAARADLDKQRAVIDAQIIKWKQLVDSLHAACADEEEDPSDVEISSLVGKGGKQTVKFTDGVRMVLRQNRSAPVTAPDVREGLLNLGFDFSKYSQPLTPIHNCLKRLEEQGEVKAERTDTGQLIGYTWISPIERAVAEDSPNYVQGIGLLDAQTIVRMQVRAVEAVAEAMKKQKKQEAETLAAIAEIRERGRRNK